VSVLTADGADGHAAGAPFDRVMTTAASSDLPTVLFDQVAAGGRVFAPIELRGGGCQVTVLRREGERFVVKRAVKGWFVPLRGLGQQRPALRVALRELPFWGEIGRLPPRRVPLPLAAWNALQVVRIGSAPVSDGRLWTKPRGGTALVWRLLPGAEDWKALLHDAP
jgi:hypothetical protein